MGRSPCCDKVGLKKGPWTPEEDQKLLAYIEEHGHGSWRALPAKAGLQRCGKSCRLRWTNYLRPDIKRGKFSLQEEQTIIQLHALLGNRWSAIATHLPKRTDNEIKNYWNTHLKKRLAKMGIDPVTHKPKNDLLSNDGVQTKNAANLSHMAQWESARLEAEARLVRESKLRLSSAANSVPLVLLSSSSSTSKTADVTTSPNSTNWSHVAGTWPKSTSGLRDLESPTSTLTFAAEKRTPAAAMIEFVGSSSAASASNSGDAGVGAAVKGEGRGEHDNWKGLDDESTYHHEEGIDHHSSLSFASGLGTEAAAPPWTNGSSGGTNHLGIDVNVLADHDDQLGLGFTSLLLNNSDDRSLSCGGGESENGGSGSGSDEQYNQDHENYWNSILNLVNSSPSDSPMF